MTRHWWHARGRLILALVAVSLLIQTFGHGQAARLHPRRVAVWGSSVANGVGDETGRDGYTGLLRQMLAARGWEVLNQSRGGDNTKTIAPRFSPEGAPDPKTRYLLPVNPSYAIIGLSIGNEGIFEATTPEAKDAIFKQYADGMEGLVDRLRQHNIVPVIALAYTRADFTAVEHEYTRRVNVLQQTWDVPSINFLGAIDDGTGRWAPGFQYDVRHPNAAGHKELFYSFVPTLFEALEKGKATPSRPTAGGFARISGGNAPLTFIPDSTVHPFAVSILVRAQGNGTIAAVSGSTLAAKTEKKQIQLPKQTIEFDSTSLTADRPFTATVGVQQGKWTYRSADGTNIISTTASDAQWHHLAVSHYTARGVTLFFVDGKLAGQVTERLEPTRFVVGGAGANGGSAPKQADYKDVLIFRAALNADEIAALNQGQLLQGSLEIYAPLNDPQFVLGGMADNRAQSLTALKVGSDKITHMADNPTN